MALGLANVRAELAFGSGYATPEDDRVYTDVTTDVLVEPGINITRGRNDRQDVVQPSVCNLTLENNDGDYTPNKTTSPYYPDVKRSTPLRITYREPGVPGNLLTANQASMETSIADWAAGGSVPPVLSQSATHPSAGSQGLLITWGTGGSLPLARTTVTGLVKGRVYTAQVQVWVPTGSVNVRLVGNGSFGSSVTTKNAHATASVSFTATAATAQIQVWPSSAATAGHQCWVDSAMVDEGTTVGAFTTSPPVIVDRFMGYVKEFPLTWPRGEGNEAETAIVATSRRSRLGKNAKLPSAIRADYLDDDPASYWPMDESAEVFDRTGRQAFRDITNAVTPGRRETETLAAWFDGGDSFKPVVRDGTLGPTDEESLVKLGRTTDAANPDWQHYIGGSLVTNIGSDLVNGCLFEMVARVTPTRRGSVEVDLARLFTGANSYSDEVRFGLSDTDAGTYMYVKMVKRDGDGATVEDPGWFYAGTAEENAAAYRTAVDGEIHHYAVAIYSGTIVLYFDGAFVAAAVFASSTFTQRFRSLAMGSRTLWADTWVGHAATYDVAPLTVADLHFAAATAASETVEERVERIAGYLSVPADEIEVDDTVAAPLGRQPEKGRSGIDVLEEVAQSTAGVLFDARDGHMVMHSRNRRWNPVSAFALSTGADQIEADLAKIVGDVDPINTVEVSRVGTEDVPLVLTDDASIAQEGINSTQLTVVTAEDTEAEAYGYDVLARNAVGPQRTPQVSVDVGDLDAATRALVLAADIGTAFDLEDLPAQSAETDEQLFVEGYVENISRGWRITFNTTTADFDAPIFIPDDPVYGVLDVGNLIPF